MSLSSHHCAFGAHIHCPLSLCFSVCMIKGTGTIPNRCFLISNASSVANRVFGKRMNILVLKKRDQEQVIHSEPALPWTSRSAAEPKEPIPPNPEVEETRLDSSPVEIQVWKASGNACLWDPLPHTFRVSLLCPVLRSLSRSPQVCRPR